MKRVTLHIDCLVLKGFRPEDRHAIADGLQHELTQLLSGPNSSEGLTKIGKVACLRLGNISITQGAKPHKVGAQVAKAITKGIGS